MAYGKAGGSQSWALWIAGGVFALCLAVLLVMRLSEGPNDPGDGEAGDPGDGAAVVVPEDAGYPNAPDDGLWPTGALDEETYIQVTAESTCKAQSFHGPPGDLTREMDRIYYHYQTTASDVAGFAAEINGDDTRAIRVGERIAGAIERCP